MGTHKDTWIVNGNIFILKEKRMFILLEMEHVLMKMDIFGLWGELMML